MNKGLINTFIFSLGAVAGSLVTYGLLKNKYEAKADEEIEKYRKELNSRNISKEKIKEESEDEIEPEVKEVKTDDHRKDYEKLINKYKVPTNDVEITIGGDDMLDPYVIPPEEFGEDEDYETESLTYYNDKVLTDDFDNPIEDIDFLVGKESLLHFGEYEDDSVFVKNEKTHTYYEILADERNYSDIKK